MTKEEFERGYQVRSNITSDFYKECLVTLPCSCSDEGCNGWAAVTNNLDTIKTHIELYIPG